MTKHLLIILSDLHLSAVQSLESDQPEAHDSFHYDTAFSHLIDHLLNRAKRDDARCEILLLGDFLDFLHTKVPLTEKNFLSTTEEAGIQKLQAILSAHAPLFEALKRFISAGFCLSVVPGNHDIDLMRPALERVLKESIGTDSCNSIHFYSWIYYVSGVLYAEHGHQYHDIAAYSTLLTPFHAGNENERELTITDYFDLYLFHLIGRLGIPSENIMAPHRYLLRQYRKQPFKLVRTFPELYKFFYAVLQQFAFRSTVQFRSARRRYHEYVLSRFAASIGLAYKTCVALDQLAELSNVKMVKRLLRRALFKDRGDSIRNGYQYPKVLMISKILGSENRAVPYYVFGHSHKPAKVALDEQRDAFYLNSGTWASPGYPGMPGDRTLFPFIEIEWESHKHPTATLMQWDETQQKPAKLGED